jgi:hypothetical protein
VQAPAGSSDAAAPVAASSASKVEAEDLPFEPDAPPAATAPAKPASGQNAQDILAMIRARQAQ